jgi:hypothetical protein
MVLILKVSFEFHLIPFCFGFVQIAFFDFFFLLSELKGVGIYDTNIFMLNVAAAVFAKSLKHLRPLSSKADVILRYIDRYIWKLALVCLLLTSFSSTVIE